MKYYSIGWSDDLKIIGHYPQTSLAKGYNPSLPNSHWQVKSNQFPDFTPNYELKLHKKAKVTDYLDGHGVFGMVVNEKFKNLLKKHKLPPHQFYPIKVYYKEKVLTYYWFHYIVDDFWKWVDKEKSKAVIYDDNKNFEAIQDLDLNMPLDYYKNLEYFELPYHQNLRWERIVFKKGFPDYDLYKSTDLDPVTFLSEKLINALQESNLIGFETKPFDKIICE